MNPTMNKYQWTRKKNLVPSGSHKWSAWHLTYKERLQIFCGTKGHRESAYGDIREYAPIYDQPFTGKMCMQCRGTWLGFKERGWLTTGGDDDNSNTG